MQITQKLKQNNNKNKIGLKTASESLMIITLKFILQFIIRTWQSVKQKHRQKNSKHTKIVNAIWFPVF